RRLPGWSKATSPTTDRQVGLGLNDASGVRRSARSAPTSLRISSATVRLRGEQAPFRANVTGGPKRTDTGARFVSALDAWTAAVPEMATGTTGAPERKASSPTAPL